MSNNLPTNSIDIIENKLSCTPSLTQHDSGDNSDSLDSEIEEIENIVEEEIEDRELYVEDIEDLEDTSNLEETSNEENEDNFNYHKLSTEAREFYKVFIEEEFGNSETSQKIELSEDVLKFFFPPPLDKVIKKRLPACFKLVNSSRPQKKLKPIPNSLIKQDRSKLKGNKWNLQSSSCKLVHKNFNKCISCNKKEFDLCRFKGVRLHPSSTGDKYGGSNLKWQEYTKKNIIFPIYSITDLELDDDSEDEEMLILNEYEKANDAFPDISLSPLPNIEDSIKSLYDKYLLNQSSDSLLKLLSVQLSLFKYTKLYLRKHNEPRHRKCDNCSGTFINIYYLNKHCGIEICYRCYLKGDTSNIASYCLRNYKHPINDFIPVTLYPKSAFQNLYNSCKSLLNQDTQHSISINDELFAYNGNDVEYDDLERLYRSYVRGTEEDIGLETCQKLMKEGSPFVVEDISPENLGYFSAKNFKTYYGNFEVNQLESHSGEYETVRFKEFFQNFDTYDSNLPPITYKKIIDYPSFSDFKTVFPKLYNAYLNALPFKQYTQPKGALNLASYLPDIFNPPDFGPQMYISTSREHRNEVTTPLSIESTDSIYIMTNSYEPEEDEPRIIQCAALWNIFDSNDIDKVREYLSFHPNYLKQSSDPIYNQEAFFTKKMLMELKEQFGVKSTQIYQNPGDCIFIPSGCAYQMVSFSNCIQISTGFISPERTTQSLNIAYELSQLPKNHPRNGDFAQVENHILFSCSNAISRLLNDKDQLIECINSKKYKDKIKILTRLGNSSFIENGRHGDSLTSFTGFSFGQEVEEEAEAEIKNRRNKEDLGTRNEKNPNLEEFMEYDKLSALAKDFIKVFVKGEYSKYKSLPSLEVCESLLKTLLPKNSHYEAFIANIPPSVSICHPLKRKNAKKSLKPLPKSKNNADNKSEWILQESACQKFPSLISRCSHCVAKQKDQCRYKGIRMIAQDINGCLIEAPFLWQNYCNLGGKYELLYSRNLKSKRLSMFDKQVNNTLEFYKKIDKNLPNIQRKSIPGIDKFIRDNNLKYILKQCSISLKGLTDLQLDLFSFSNIHFKSTPITGQHQCDNCNITLLNIYFLNTHCGIELCFNCYLMDNKSNIASKCLKNFEHPITEFIPVTVFPKDIIQWLKNSCDKLIKEEEPVASTIDEKLYVYNGKDINEKEYDRLYKPYLRGTEEEIGLETYQSLMQQGSPFVVKDIRLDQLEYFGAESLRKYYGEVEIEQFVDSSQYETKVKLKDFLKEFDGCENNNNNMLYNQINDWPSFSDFKTVFPKLYNAFLNALPFKCCTQPDGLLNLTSYLPQVLNPPDLGPKLYIATGRKETGNGSTLLNLNASDAVYIMTHSYKSGYERPNIECGALWHLFANCDVPKIRQYLAKWAKAKNKQNDFSDFIHDHKIYLTEPMLEELYNKYNVRAYQIYQNPGDTVFVPAGCAYQVLNLRNCIQVSTGYISPERTVQCMHIAKEFSKLPKQHPRNFDLAQVENHILYSCSHAISILLNTEDRLLDYTIQAPESATNKKNSKGHFKRDSNDQIGNQESKKLKKSPSENHPYLRPRLSRNAKIARFNKTVII